MTEKCTQERFLSDISTHRMTVMKDDGLYRHLSFTKEGKGGTTYRFDLITWPGFLTICGDMGTYVFRRVQDMFTFFRADSNNWKGGNGTIRINPGYWAQKIEAEASNSSYGAQFCKDTFDESVLEHFEGYAEDIDEEEREELLEEIKDRLLGHGCEVECIQALHDWDNDKLDFSDFWERNTTAYTFRYIWCLYAIVWGIGEYDAACVELDEQVEVNHG